jgi:putative transposase
MKTVSRTLGVARSNLIERRDKVTQSRGAYRKAEDASLVLPIRAIVDKRPTYGYRRVWALLNRHLRSIGRPTVNMKRVLRIMQNHGLTLETPYRPSPWPHA